MKIKMLCIKNKCRGKDENGFCKGYNEAIESGERFNCVYGIRTDQTTNSTPVFRKPARVDVFTVNFPRDSFLNKQLKSAKADYDCIKEDSIKEVRAEGRWEKSNPYLKTDKERKSEREENNANFLFSLIDSYCKKFEKIIITQIGNDTIKIKFENKRNKK